MPIFDLLCCIQGRDARQTRPRESLFAEHRQLGPVLATASEDHWSSCRAPSPEDKAVPRRPSRRPTHSEQTRGNGSLQANGAPACESIQEEQVPIPKQVPSLNDGRTPLEGLAPKPSISEAAEIDETKRARLNELMQSLCGSVHRWPAAGTGLPPQEVADTMPPSSTWRHAHLALMPAEYGAGAPVNVALWNFEAEDAELEPDVAARGQKLQNTKKPESSVRLTRITKVKHLTALEDGRLVKVIHKEKGQLRELMLLRGSVEEARAFVDNLTECINIVRASEGRSASSKTTLSAKVKMLGVMGKLKADAAAQPDGKAKATE
eukprot:gnl/TRDRNA2_/TRDRNA2_168331_c1_seq1.p1 gnl/TRDRNA2_/TRDRNA2_168331_c1~~gnl/TRDRNA2_/TRDRNA2_168331_c1_seq1.p1  ORF type:complete len:321 (+),score=43.53 gnl/TRDRNA2_/TRDRNA2_168331_c1_seq1:47-1009(+)